MAPGNQPSSEDSPLRSHAKLAREIALALAIKLILILLIKFTFFNEPVSKASVVERMDAVFSIRPADSRTSTTPDSQRKAND